MASYQYYCHWSFSIRFKLCYLATHMFKIIYPAGFVAWTDNVMEIIGEFIAVAKSYIYIICLKIFLKPCIKDLGLIKLHGFIEFLWFLQKTNTFCCCCRISHTHGCKNQYDWVLMKNIVFLGQCFFTFVFILLIYVCCYCNWYYLGIQLTWCQISRK